MIRLVRTPRDCLPIYKPCRSQKSSYPPELGKSGRKYLQCKGGVSEPRVTHRLHPQNERLPSTLCREWTTVNSVLVSDLGGGLDLHPVCRMGSTLGTTFGCILLFQSDRNVPPLGSFMVTRPEGILYAVVISIRPVIG